MRSVPLALLLVAVSPMAAIANPIAVTGKSGPSLLNGTPLTVGDRLNQPGDTVRTKDKAWAGLAFPAVKGSAVLKQNSEMRVSRVGKQYQLKVPVGVLDIKLLALKNGIGITKEESKASAAPLSVIGPGEQLVEPLSDGVRFGVVANDIDDGGSICVAVDEGQVRLQVPSGEAAVINPGFTGCAIGEVLSSPVTTDEAFDIDIEPYPWPANVEPIPGICLLKTAPGNQLRVEANRGTTPIGETMLYLPLVADGLHQYDFVNQRIVDVLNPFGEYKPVIVRACS